MPPKTHLFGPLPLSSTFLVPPTIGLQIWESFLCFLAAASSPFPFPLPPSKLLTFQNTRTLFFFFDIYHREFFQLIYNPFFLDPLHSIHTTPKEKKNSRRLQEQKNSFLVTLILIYQLDSLSRGGHRLYVESFKEGILTSMGEAPAFFADSFLGDFPNGVDLKSKGHETAVCVGSKIYVIGGDDHESTAVFGVRIFDKSSGEWINPTVLGNKPKLSSGHSAVLLHGDRILVIKGNSKSDDCFWFLEVGTPFIREQEKPHGNEVVAWSRGVLGNVEKPIVISGPSGVGKGTLISKLMKEFPSMFGFSVSHTTRAPREKEQNSVHYHFSDRSVMERDIKDGKFLEFASVHGNLYGTSIEAVEVVADAGKRCILDIDVQGARSVRASSLDAIFIFISPPSFEELEKRLRARATETEEQIQKRLRNAKTELEEGKSSGLFDHILVNDDLESCYENLKNILGLTEGAKTACITYPELVDLPVEPLVSKLDQKILITSDAAEYQKASDNMYVLDLSLLKGGAPGRTRGLNLYVTNPSADRVNDDNQLS